MKKILVKIRSSIKFLILIVIGLALIVGAFAFLYKPIYRVTLDGEVVGYCAKKNELQKRISDYIENGNGDNGNLAFISIDEMPTYNMCLLKKGIETNDEEIFQKVADRGIAYYKYYAILEDDEEKAYVSDFKTAEAVVKKLKKKDSNNIDDITIKEKYETDLKGFISEDKAVAKLYEKKIVIPKKTNTYRVSSCTVTTSRHISQGKASLGLSLIKPVSGMLSSRFGNMSRLRSGAHTGLDIATSYGTGVKAAASGVVTFSGWKGSYGKLIVVTHKNGVQTYYGHCSSLYASVGQKVSQGEKIAAVGSTGNSTGPHLHFEVRVNGVAYNPQNYIY